MKLWRANAINESREKGDLNAIEIMKLKHGCLPIINMEKNPEPYGAGALPLQKNTRLEKYDEVAAFVEETNTWILAEVIKIFLKMEFRYIYQGCKWPQKSTILIMKHFYSLDNLIGFFLIFEKADKFLHQPRNGYPKPYANAFNCSIKNEMNIPGSENVDS